MSKYILLDASNLFYRVRHTAHRNADISEKIALSMHMILSSANKIIKNSNIDHVIFAMEGRGNWRKSFYSPYKKQRADKRQRRTEDEVEEDNLYLDHYNELMGYLDKSTNCSVIGVPGAEADDVIARFIHLHPDDKHIIVSTDSDFYQLISNNVSQYNGVTGEMIKISGTFNDYGKQVIDKKTKLPKIIEDPEWLLFEKCIRGDKSDNVFSSFPGVRKKGTKKKVGLLEAYADRERKGYDWNSVMLSTWKDHLGVDHKVIDDYNRNKTLIDLSMQPDDIKDKVDEGIIDVVLLNGIKYIPASTMGFNFIKFCAKHDLQRLSDSAPEFTKWLAKPYRGYINDIYTKGIK